MKLNKNIINNATVILFIILVSTYHILIQNSLEKLFSETYFKGFKFTKRPLETCLNSANGIPSYCKGMPSGHSETITIFATLLYLYKFIPLWLCILLIFIIGLQRILSSFHTVMQVLVGIFLGYMYSKIYRYYNFSYYSFLVVFGIGLLLLSLILLRINLPLQQHTSMK